jgi:hypothetical protein
VKQNAGPLGILDLLTKPELEESLHNTFSHKIDHIIREMHRAETFMRLPLIQGYASGGVLNLVSTVGPYQGYAWDIGLLGISGLTTGTTPDVVNMTFGGGPAVPWWQFNGNNFAYTFSRGQLVMLPGETITLQSTGAFAATGQITMFGMIRTEMPSEKIAAVVS